jgi:hypothetical protein
MKQRLESGCNVKKGIRIYLRFCFVIFGTSAFGESEL